MNKKRFLLFAGVSSAIFFIALAGFLWFGDEKPSRSKQRLMEPTHPDSMSFAEVVARASSSYVAVKKRFGDKGMAKIMRGVVELSDEDMNSERQVIVIDTLDPIIKFGLTQAEIDALEQRRMEAHAASSAIFKAFMEKHGVEGLAEAVLKIAEAGTERVYLDDEVVDLTEPK